MSIPPFTEILEIGSDGSTTVNLDNNPGTVRADWLNGFIYLFGLGASNEGVVQYGLATGGGANEILSSALFTGGFADEVLTDHNAIDPDGSVYLFGGNPTFGLAGLPSRIYKADPAGWAIIANFGSVSAPVTTGVKSCAVLAGGAGFSSAAVTFDATYGSGAAATATIVGGIITAIVMVMEGNYTAAPTFTITGDGVGALGIVASMSDAIAYQASDGTHIAQPNDLCLVADDDGTNPGPFIACIQKYAPVQWSLYDSATSYDLGNVVFDPDGAFWISTQNANVGNPLVNGFDYTSGTLTGAWLLIPAWGQTGAPTLSTPGIYFYGDPVSFAGQVYFCQQDDTVVAGGNPSEGNGWGLSPPLWFGSDSNGWRYSDCVWYTTGADAGQFWLCTADLTATSDPPANPHWLSIGALGNCNPGTRIGTATTPASLATNGLGAEVSILDCRSSGIAFLAGANSFGIDEPSGWIAADISGNSPGFFVVLGTDSYNLQQAGYGSNAANPDVSTMDLGYYAGGVDTGGGSFLVKFGTVAASAIDGAASFVTAAGCLYDDASDTMVAKVTMNDGLGGKFDAIIGIGVVSSLGVKWVVQPTLMGGVFQNPMNTFVCAGGTYVLIENLPGGSGSTFSKMLEIVMATGAFTETDIAGVTSFGSGDAYNDAVGGTSGTYLLQYTGYDSTKPGAPTRRLSTPSSFFWFAALTGPPAPPPPAGNTYMIERMDNRIWAANEDVWCVDCGLSIDLPTPAEDITASSSTGAGIPTGVTGLFGGQGYSAGTTGTIVDPTGTGAAIVLTIGSGIITAVTISGGTNYTYPVIQFDDPAGTGMGAEADVVLDNSATFSASAPVFGSGDVGSVIRMGGGIAEITTFTDSQHVTANLIAPIVRIIPNSGGMPAPALSGQWSMAPKVTTVGGLWHLIGFTVTGTADGAVITPRIVQPDGTITLDAPASLVTVGLFFLSQLQTLYFDGGQPTVQTKRKKIGSASVRFEATGVDTILVGSNQPDGSAQSPAQIETLWLNMTSADLAPNLNKPPYGSAIAPLYTGDATKIPVTGGYAKPGQVALMQTACLPMNVLAIAPSVEMGDDSEQGWPKDQRAPPPNGGRR